MDQQKRDKILTASRNLEHRELTPEPWFDPYSDMTPEEKSKLIIELMSARQADRERIDSLMEKLDKMTECLLQSNEESRLLRSQLSDMDSLRRENAALKERSKLNSKHTYGSRSQKGITSKSKSSREKDKEDFDGTGGSISSDSESESIEPDSADTDKAEKDVKEYRLYRRGLEYRTMRAGKSVVHDSDKSRLPEGVALIKTFSKYSYEQVSEIVEHRYNVFRYKMPDGRIYDGYFPSEGEPETIDMVLGTHASSSFLAYLAFNKYVLDTPLYRELSRIVDEDMHVSRMPLTNWLAKGTSYIKRSGNSLKR